ncbi:MAG: energy transducer TonB [Lacunisphaera sp.]|nr:energy transducer TonB [Lacunisphaera sp.]
MSAPNAPCPLFCPRPWPARRGWILLAATVAVLLGGPAARAAEPESNAPVAAKPPHRVAPGLTRTVVPVHPPALLAKFVDGEATVELLISETGAVTEAKVHSATDPAFGEAALTALRQWEFTPGSVDGKPTPFRVLVPVNFSVTLEQRLSVVAGRQVFRAIDEPVIPAAELPAWPVPRKALNPPYPKELAGSGKYGKAVVSLVIDKDGLVINPRIVKATYPEFQVPALLTAMQLKFPPQIMADRKRIFVSVDIQFDFRAESSSRPAKSAEKKNPPEPAKKAEK